MKILSDFAITIRVEIPALDRLVSLLEAAQQSEVDALTAKVKQLTGKLSTSQRALQGAIDSEQEK